MTLAELMTALIALAGVAATTFAVLIGASFAAHVAGVALAAVIVAMLVSAVADQTQRRKRWPRR